MFTLLAESHKDVIILRLSGDMLLADVAQLNPELDAYLLSPGVSQIVLDLNRIERGGHFRSWRSGQQEH